MALELLVVLQFIILGAFGDKWNVTYKLHEICALEGSEVHMYGSFSFPIGLKVKEVFWTVNPFKNVDSIILKESPDYRGRVKCFIENQTVSLKISNVTKRDEAKYCLRIIKDKKTDRHLGYPGVSLRVTDLSVESPENVTEGNQTLLKCITKCNLTDSPEFIWYKNGHQIDTTNKGQNILFLHQSSQEDTGSYSCAVKGYEHRPSPVAFLSVTYPPKKATVSISPSGDIVEGSSVTLTCSSEANPPVENYTWFKNKTFMGRGKTLTISDISSKDSGEYKCKSMNAVGCQYSAVILKVKGKQSKVYYGSISILLVFACLSTAITLLFLRSKRNVLLKSREGDIQYASVRFNPLHRSNDEMLENSVIYSMVK